MRLACLLAAAGSLAFSQVRLPPYQRTVLPNGLTVYSLPRAGVPLVTIRAVARGGSESDPKELAGLASVTAEMLRKGAGGRSAAVYAEQLDSLGATLEIEVDDQSSSLTLECLAKDFDAGLTLLADAIRRPAFEEAEVKKLIAQRMDGVKAMKDNPRAAGSQYWRAFFYGTAHPYGNVPEEASLSRIDRKQIAAHHERMYTGSNLTIAVVGAVESPVALKAVTSAFGSTVKGEAYAWKSAPIPEIAGHQGILVDKPDATQTLFYIGKPGIARDHPDRVSLWLVNTLFGGRFTSMLNDELRVNSGLTYGISSSFDRNKLPGRISISASTSTENTAKALDMTLAILGRLTEKGIAAEQLQSAKTYLKGTYPSERLETPDQLAEILTELELFGLNRGEVDDLFSRIDAVTVEQANAVARKYFAGGSLRFLFVGQAAKIRGDVKKFAPKIPEVAISRAGFRAP